MSVAKLVHEIELRFPDGLLYDEAVQMCRWLHLLDNTLPSEYGQYAGHKGEIAETFAHLAKMGKICDNEGNINKISELTEKVYWSEILDCLYRDKLPLDYSFPARFPDIFGKSS